MKKGSIINAELLNLGEAIITKAENILDELHVHLKLQRKAQICPRCGTATACVHDYRAQIIKDIPLGKTTYLFPRCHCCGEQILCGSPSFLGYGTGAEK